MKGCFFTLQGLRVKIIFLTSSLALQVIIFSFSKRECEELAQQMIDIDLNNSKEKKLVKGIFENAMDILAQEDRNLAQINGVLPMLMRGIGIHHSGLLPIVKEVIEILFQEGLLKVWTFDVTTTPQKRTPISDNWNFQRFEKF